MSQSTPSPQQIIQAALEEIMGHNQLHAIAAARAERLLARKVNHMGNDKHFIMATDKERLTWGHIR